MTLTPLQKVTTFCLILMIIVLSGLAFMRFIMMPRIDKSMNEVIAHTPYRVSDQAAKLHTSLNIADLHADTLLWQRNPERRHQRGHTDLPRLREGQVALQIFTTVTKSPPDLNYEKNNADKDDITALAIAQMWPPRTWKSIFARAHYQAERLKKIAHNDPDFYLIRTRQDLSRTITKRRNNKNIIAGILGMEGAHPLEGKIENLGTLYDAGFRVIGLQHFFDNELGGSLHGISGDGHGISGDGHGISGDGLTPFGRAVIAWANSHHMIIDVAHSSHKVVKQTLEASIKPLIVSHTGFAGHCPSRRNIPDELIRQITQKGGLIGVGFWGDVICDPSPKGIALALQYGVNNFGVDHIALGSDFDGTVQTALDASELAAITQELLTLGMDEETIAKIMGENAIAFFQNNLP